jgi:hypothetical protein
MLLVIFIHDFFSNYIRIYIIELVSTPILEIIYIYIYIWVLYLRFEYKKIAEEKKTFILEIREKKFVLYMMVHGMLDSWSHKSHN